MSQKELEEQVWQFIDDNCMELTQEEYLDFLLGLKSDAETRAETVELEIEDKQ